MPDRSDFETRLEERLRARAALASRPFDAFAIAHEVIGADARRRGISGLAWPTARPALVWLLVALLLAIALLGAAVGGALLQERPPLPASVVSNGWIAYSTGGQIPGTTDSTTGSDIYLVREGSEPTLIAGREGGTTRNVCPAFSPDGSRLAFGVALNQGRAIVVLRVDATGVVGDPVRITVPGSGPPVCPRWSSDGARVAYLDGERVVVRGLDGSRPATRVAGDPRSEAFFPPSLPNGAILSPTGDRIIWQPEPSGAGCTVVVARPDGAAAHVIPPLVCGWAVAWSPDAKQVLFMTDVGDAFDIRAVAVDSPFAVTTIVSNVPVNGARSWPGWGDVSWQRVLTPSTPTPALTPTPAPTPRASAPASGGVGSAAPAQTGYVGLTVGSGAAGFAGVVCQETVDGLSVSSGLSDGDAFALVIRSDGTVSSLSGALRGVAWEVTQNPQGTLKADRSGTFSGKDAISGADVSGTFAC